jgi:hypothetical protein
MMQHRDIAIDEVKRSRGSWTTKLEMVAKYEIEMTPQEQYSSSRNLVFSRMMKERAEKEILPSLFDVSHSYEDYVAQHQLWTYKDVSKAPIGKEITWQFVPRPPKQVCRKRLRPTTMRKMLQQASVIDTPLDNSGDETEIDEDMVELSNKIIRRAQAVAARNEARAAAAQVASGDKDPLESVAKVSTPVAVQDDPAPAMPHQGFISTSPKTTPAHTPTLTPMPTPNSSFGQSMAHLRVQDDIKGGHQTTIDNHAQQAHGDVQSLDEPMRYHSHQINYSNAPFQHMQEMGSFVHAGSPAFGQFASHGFMNTGQFPVYNNSYPLQMGHAPFGSNMPPNNMGCPYEGDTIFAPMDLSMPGAPCQANMSFNGLPYDFDSGSPGPQHQYSKP